MALIGINRLGEYLQQKKENQQSVSIGRLSEEDVEVLFAALDLSPEQAEGNCSGYLNEGKTIRERGLAFNR